MELEYLEFEIREIDDEQGVVSGLAIPYNQTVTVKGRQERMAPGAFDESVGQPIFYGHDHKALQMPVGKIIESRSDDEGLHIKAQISNTTKGNDVKTLLRDGVVKNFSVGFTPDKQSMQDGVMVRTKATLHELSITPFPAYAGAAVTEFRENQTKEQDDNKMENEQIENVSNEVAELRATVTDLERKVNEPRETLVVNEPSIWETRTLGEIMKGVQLGEITEQQLETRAYTGGTSADVGKINTWFDRKIQIMQDARVFLNLWNKAPLPDEGLTLQYPTFSSTTGSAGIQANEGDQLSYTKLVTTTATAAVQTLGTYSQLSRQEVERLSPSYLEAVFDQMAYNYAKLSNATVRTAVTGAATGTGTVTDHTLASAWIVGVFNACNTINQLNLGLKADFMVVSPATMAQIVAVVDTAGRPVFAQTGNTGVNTIGSANITGFSAVIAGLPVVYDPGLTGAHAYVAPSQAVTVYENAGAPNTLQFQDILSLFNDFSLYGYLASATFNPAAIVNITVS